MKVHKKSKVGKLVFHVEKVGKIRAHTGYKIILGIRQQAETTKDFIRSNIKIVIRSKKKR